MKNYVIDMTESAAVTVITTESRNLRGLPFRPTEDQLTTGKAWEEWLDDIEREFRYFRIGNPADRKDAMIIYGGKEIARLEKSLPDPVDAFNEYEKLRKKLNDYFLPKQNKHYARYVFLRMRPLAGEATISYAARLRENAYACEFKDTFGDRILEHMIQTIENQHLIQKCIAKSWDLSQFLLEAAQTEDISLQMHDMKETLDDRRIARVRIPKKQRAYRKHCRSDDEDEAKGCRYCGYDRKHRKIEDCPAYGKRCHKCQKLNHFASVCKSQRYTDDNSKQEKKIGCIYKNSKIKKTWESDTSDSSDDDFLSKSAAHMLRIKTLKSAPCVEKSATDVRFLEKEEVNFSGQQKQGMEAMIQMRDELHRHTQEIEMRLEQKLSEFIVQLSVLINTEALVFPCDKMSNMQMKDETDNDRCMQSNRNKMGVQSNNSQTQVENDRCTSTNQTTNQTANLQSRIESDDESRKRDGDWEDSSFIDEGGWATNYLTTRDKPTRGGRKKGKGKLHT